MRRRFGPDVRIGYRLTVLQRLMPTIVAILAIGVFQLLIWLANGQIYIAVTGRLAEMWAVAGIARVLYGRGNFGVGLTPAALEVHNLRRRTIPWTEVQAIRVERILDSRTVVVYEASGQRTRLRAPVTGVFFWDKRFDEKFHTLKRWWLDCRAINQASPAPGPRP